MSRVRARVISRPVRRGEFRGNENGEKFNRRGWPPHVKFSPAPKDNPKECAADIKIINVSVREKCRAPRFVEIFQIVITFHSSFVRDFI